MNLAEAFSGGEGDDAQAPAGGDRSRLVIAAVVVLVLLVLYWWFYMRVPAAAVSERFKLSDLRKERVGRGSNPFGGSPRVR